MTKECNMSKKNTEKKSAVIDLTAAPKVKNKKNDW